MGSLPKGGWSISSNLDVPLCGVCSVTHLKHGNMDHCQKSPILDGYQEGKPA